MSQLDRRQAAHRVRNIQALIARVLAGEIPGVASIRIEPDRLVLHPVLELPLDGTWRITDDGRLDFRPQN